LSGKCFRAPELAHQESENVGGTPEPFPLQEFAPTKYLTMGITSSSATKLEGDKIDHALHHHHAACIRRHEIGAGLIFMQAAELEMQS
jgi:hypothetical protein